MLSVRANNGNGKLNSSAFIGPHLWQYSVLAFLASWRFKIFQPIGFGW
jgi:hypothetical protein